MAVSLGLAATSALGQNTTVYRHVDEKGVVTFSDTPPEGELEAETVTSRRPQPRTRMPT